MSGYRLTILGKLTLTLLVAILAMIAVMIGGALFAHDNIGLAAGTPDEEQKPSTLLFDKPAGLPLVAKAPDPEDSSDGDVSEKAKDADGGDAEDGTESLPSGEESEPEAAPEETPEAERTPALVVYFGPDSDALTEEGAAALDEWLASAELSGYTVVLEGNAFRREMYLDNYAKDLSRSRAKGVETYLKGTGVPGENLTVVVNGGDNPVSPEEDGSRWRTRRVEVYLIPLEPAFPPG